MSYKGYRDMFWGSVYKNQVHEKDTEDKTILFFMCLRCLKKFEIEVDRLVFKLNPSAVASYMKKYCPDCEAFFEMEKQKPEKKDENNLYGRKIEID